MRLKATVFFQVKIKANSTLLRNIEKSNISVFGRIKNDVLSTERQLGNRCLEIRDQDEILFPRHFLPLKWCRIPKVAAPVTKLGNIVAQTLFLAMFPGWLN